MEPKKPWFSKTMWLNFLMGIAAGVAVFLPQANELTVWINGHMGEIGIGWSILGMFLRAISKDRISLDE
jgi:hypothetical protein